MKGQLVVGPNGKSIFIPTAGYYHDGKLSYFAVFGYYWTKTLYEINPGCAYYLAFDQAKDDGYFSYIGLDYIGGRSSGYPIRPVVSSYMKKSETIKTLLNTPQSKGGKSTAQKKPQAPSKPPLTK